MLTVHKSLLLKIICLLLIITCSSPAFSETENLADVYQAALASDPVYAAATASYQATLEAKPQARSALLPQISAFAGYSQIDQSFEDANAIFSSLSSTNFDSRNYGIRLDQVIFNRQARVQLHQADASIARAAATLANARQDLIVRVTEAYFEVLTAQDALEYLGAEKEAIKQQLEQATARFEVGLIAITDVQETQARFDLATAQELAAESGLAISIENLRALTGADTQQLETLNEASPLPLPEPNDIDQWVETASASNPQVIAAEYTWEIARQEIQRRKGERYPTIGFRAQTGDQINDGGFSEGTSSDTTLGLQLNIPLYTGGYIKSQVNEAASLARVAEHQLETTRRNVVRNTRAQYLNVLSQISQVKALQQALKSTRTAAEAAEAGFEAGTRTSVDVLIALSQTYAAQRDYSRARYDFILNSLRLKQAAGAVTETDISMINEWLISSS